MLNKLVELLTYNNFIRIILVGIELISLLMLIGLFFSNYIFEAFFAYSMPFAILAGLDAIAIAIYEKDKRQ